VQDPALAPCAPHDSTFPEAMVEDAAQRRREVDEKERQSHERQLREAFNREWREVMERLSYDYTPTPEVLNYPDNWDEVVR